MRYALSVLTVFAMGCGASIPVVQYGSIPERQHVESKALPDAPDKTEIPKEKNWVMALPASTCTDIKGKERKVQGGVVLSPEKAARAKKWQLGYRALRSLYETDRQIWTQHRIVYIERTNQANREIVRLSPSWWTESKGTLAWAAGFVMGAAATVAIVYAVDEVKQ